MFITNQTIISTIKVRDLAYKLNNIFMENLIFIDSKKAFEEAINMKILSENKAEINFAGNFMYMGTKNGLHQFKHIDTHKYGFDLKSINEAAINV